MEDIICIDETSIKSLQKRNHCYNELGKRCVIKTKVNIEILYDKIISLENRMLSIEKKLDAIIGVNS